MGVYLFIGESQRDVQLNLFIPYRVSKRGVTCSILVYRPQRGVHLFVQYMNNAVFITCIVCGLL